MKTTDEVDWRLLRAIDRLHAVSNEDAFEVAFVALGSNVGDREAHLAAARAALAALPQSRLLAESSIEETEPLGDVPQGPYLNQMVALQTALAPRALLAALQTIERSEGRERTVRWGPRTLDLDIVDWRDASGSARTIAEPELTVPHPSKDARDFWTRERAELDTLLGAQT
jgi:2-amino-4-hydroxy-6-hydroxymethyldihydropteridine diphosphokinase